MLLGELLLVTRPTGTALLGVGRSLLQALLLPIHLPRLPSLLLPVLCLLLQTATHRAELVFCLLKL